MPICSVTLYSSVVYLTVKSVSLPHSMQNRIVLLLFIAKLRTEHDVERSHRKIRLSTIPTFA